MKLLLETRYNRGTSFEKRRDNERKRKESHSAKTLVNATFLDIKKPPKIGG